MARSGRRLTIRMRSCSCGASAMSVDGRAAWPIGANSKSCYREQKSAGRARPASRRHGPARPPGFLTNSLISIGYGTRRTCGRASRPASFARAQTKLTGLLAISTAIASKTAPGKPASAARISAQPTGLPVFFPLRTLTSARAGRPTLPGRARCAPAPSFRPPAPQDAARRAPGVRSPDRDTDHATGPRDGQPSRAARNAVDTG